MLENEKIETFQSLYIETFFNKQLISCGISFVIERNERYFLITNKHNVTGKNHEGRCLSPTAAVPNLLKVYFRRKDDHHSTIPKTISLYSEDDIDDQNALWINHPNQSQFIDVVCIHLEIYPDVDFYPVNIFEGIEFEKSETDIVSVVGYPFGLQGEHKSAIWSTGFIASNPAYNYENQDKFLIDCRSRKGQSGSPVYAYNQAGIAQRSGEHNLFFAEPTTKFMGIYSGRVNEESDLGFVWKRNVIEEIILEAIKN